MDATGAVSFNPGPSIESAFNRIGVSPLTGTIDLTYLLRLGLLIDAPGFDGVSPTN